MGIKTAVTAATLILGAAATAAQEGAVKRIIPGGQDGDRSYYTVSCGDSVRASVIVEHDRGQVCALPLGAERRCQADWTIESAAASACKSSVRG